MQHVKPSAFLNAQNIIPFPSPSPALREYPTRAELVKFFTYDRKTGKLYNRVSRGKAKAGEESGTKLAMRNGITNNWYTRIKFKGKPYLAHHLIQIMMRAPLTLGTEIDHKNGIGFDNRLRNLRVVTHAENGRNLSKASNNTSGRTGVVAVRGKWTASIHFEGVRRHLGTFARKSDAIIARVAAEAKFGFHKNHGRLALAA